MSDWGHDFRPDYRRIRTLIAELGEGIPVLATTATANDRVVADVAANWVSAAAKPLVLRGGLDRESLRLSVVRCGQPAAARGVARREPEPLPGSGIVYTLTVAQANDVAGLLRERGHAVAAYTGATEAAEREQLEADLLANRVKALVATSALGMGFDKPDLGFVVHLGAPSVADRLLPAGRPRGPLHRTRRGGAAARRGGPGRLALLRLGGVSLRSHGAQRDRALDPDRAQSTPALEPLVDMGRTRLEMVLKVLDVDGAVRRVKGGWIGTGQAWVYDEERYRRLDEARTREQQAMLDYQTPPTAG